MSEHPTEYGASVERLRQGRHIITQLDLLSVRLDAIYPSLTPDEVGVMLEMAASCVCALPNSLRLPSAASLTTRFMVAGCRRNDLAQKMSNSAAHWRHTADQKMAVIHSNPK